MPANEALLPESLSPARPAAKPHRRFGRWFRFIAGARIATSRLLLAGLAGFCLVSRSSWAASAPVSAALLITAGLLLTGVAAAGRLWCSLYIAGFKDKKLVESGPYSICRHPLYFFSLLGAIGAAAASGTITIPLLVAVLFMTGYQPVMAAEERKLARLFGAEHEFYRQLVPRFFPRWRLLRDGESWVSHPAIFRRHASAVIWFPAAAGLMLVLKALQTTLGIPVLFHLP